MLLVGCVLVRSASAELIIATDMTIDYRIAFSNGTVRVIDGFAGPTTVEVVDGADIIPHLGVSEHSVLNLRGGVTQRGVGASDFGTINIFGGLHADEDLTMGDHSTANIYGGILADDIHASGSSVVNLYGGTFAKAGGGALLGVEEDGVINIFGRGFEIDLDPPTSPSFPHLTGFLNDGSPLDVRLFNESATLGFEQIVLHEIPEPSTFSIGLLGLFLLLIYGRVRGRVTTLSCGRFRVETKLPAARERSDLKSHLERRRPIIKYAIAVLLLGCVMVRSASAEFIIRTDTTLNFRIVFDVGSVSVIDGVAGPTTVEIVDGAVISPDVSVTDHSVLNLRGGETQRGVGAGGFATINVYGGLVAGEDLIVIDHSTANIYGGILGDDIHAHGSAVVNLYGGTFAGFGRGASLLVQEDGVINVFGSDFEINLDPSGPPFPRLQGFLSDGSPLDVHLITEELNLGSAEIVLHEIPEPSAFSICLLGLFLLLLHGRLRRRFRVRKSAKRAANRTREQTPDCSACGRTLDLTQLCFPYFSSMFTIMPKGV